MADHVDGALARETWRLAEPLHSMIYFAAEGIERYTAIGLRGMHMGYFASRGAALGPVSANVVISTFYNFAPAVVSRAIPDAWGFAEPATVIAARREGATAALRRALGPTADSPEIAEAAELAGRAARAVFDRTEGRPLFAAHAALDWPDEPLLSLWHAQTLLREFRGDGHIAALMIEGLSGIEALILHSATGDVSAETLRTIRGWTEEEWAAAVTGLQERGLLAPGGEIAFSEAGRAQRQWIEEMTDKLSVPAYAGIGAEGCHRLGALARPLSRAVVDAGLLPGRRPPAN
ncbi:MAG TPA: hypothetical protein VFX16_08130 [Pseudonocardiaceae bacterium]|nr:hypothetical protein [Pseudonocardiaceae bacterium]